MGIPLTKGPHHQQEQQSGPEAIRVSEALGGGSTQQVGSDATNMASPPDSAPAVTLETEEDAAMTTAGGEAEGLTTPDAFESGGDSNGGGDGEGLKEVTLRTAPQDARFPTANQSRRCYVAYNEYHKCVKERGKDSGDCKPYMRAYRSICPDEWIEKWRELRDSGSWYGKY